MSIVNVIFLMISIAAAIFTAVITYKFAAESNFHPIATASACIVMAIIAGGTWLPATLALCVLFAAGKKVELD